MNKSRLGVFSQLDYRDPEEYLRNWWKIGPLISSSGLDYNQKTLRKRGLRIHKDRREAALFCFALRVATNDPTLDFAMTGDSDHDAVFRSALRARLHFIPVQLKEVVPARLDPAANIEREIAKLEKYTDSLDLAVGIFLDQDGVSDLGAIKPRALRVGSVWIFGCCSPDKSKWFVFGNLLSNPSHFEFLHPQ